MKKIALMMMVASTFALSACQTLQNSGNKQIIGAGTGAVLGGVLGSNIGDGSGQLWATGAGALIGALVGSEIGKSLDTVDRLEMGNAVEEAQTAPVGEPISWNNPDTGNHGEVVATKDGYSASGKYCREFQQTVFIGGQEESAYGTACQQPDGSWQIVN
ncbi:MAG: RT0821/Lpp0805 family surface protein [Alphaproteobacteria bacterium]